METAVSTHLVHSEIPGAAIDHDQQFRQWLSLNFESIVDRWLMAIDPFLTRSGYTHAFVRARLQGLVQGIASAMLSDSPTPRLPEEFGGSWANFCAMELDGLIAMRAVITSTFWGGLPDEFRQHYQERFDQLLTRMIVGFCAVMAETAAGKVPVAVSPAPDSAAGIVASAFVDFPVATTVFDLADQTGVAFNQPMLDLLGYTDEELRKLPDPEFYADDAPDDDLDKGIELLAGKINRIERETAYRHKSGASIHCRVVMWVVRDPEGQGIAIVATYHPQEIDNATDNRWQISEQRFRYLVQLSLDPTFIVSPTGVMTYTSPSTERSLGYLGDSLIDTPFWSLVYEEDISRVQAFLVELLAWPRRTQLLEVRLLRTDGLWRWHELSGANLADVPEVMGCVIQARDISERKRMEAALAAQARIDPLTGLLNRRGMVELLDQAVQRREATGQAIGLFFIDLDHFKEINDQFGHEQGDGVLAAIGARLVDAIGSEAQAARMGGDEFVILREQATPVIMEELHSRIREAICGEVELDRQRHQTSGSIGMVLGNRGHQSGAALLRAADASLYQAKATR